MIRTLMLDELPAESDALAEPHESKIVLEFLRGDPLSRGHRTDAFTSNAVMHAGIPALC